VCVGVVFSLRLLCCYSHSFTQPFDLFVEQTNAEGKEEETGDKKRKKILFGQCNNNVFVNSAYLAIVDQN
ncbi:AAEL009687-PA, partial [Aedes aegypti]